MTLYYVITFTLVFLITEFTYLALEKKGMPWNCILYKSGAKFTYAITRKGHLHRLMMPMFLHTGFFHIFWNIISFFMIGFSIEAAINDWRKYSLLLFLGAIGGNSFSAVIDPYNLGVGASTSLFAVLGCLCMWFYINFDRMGPFKY